MVMVMMRGRGIEGEKGLFLLDSGRRYGNSWGIKVQR
jgi:hypothetical protein